MSDQAKATDRSPLVSVVIACYNCERYIAKAIDSVLHQSMSDFEIIVVDDCSSDASRAVVAAYEDSRVSLVALSQNSGPSKARNEGVRRARGKWIAVLDGDDWFSPTRLERLLREADRTSADVIADDLFIIYDGEPLPRTSWFHQYEFTVPESGVLSATDLVANEIGVVKALIRRTSLDGVKGPYDESVRYGEDFLLYLDLILRGCKFVILDEPLYFLRRGNTGSLTTNHIQLVSKVLDLNLSIRLRKDVQSDRNLVAVLEKRIGELRALLRYHKVAYPLRRKEWKNALRMIFQDPGALMLVSGRTINAVRRAIRGVGGR